MLKSKFKALEDTKKAVSSSINVVESYAQSKDEGDCSDEEVADGNEAEEEKKLIQEEPKSSKEPQFNDDKEETPRENTE